MTRGRQSKVVSIIEKYDLHSLGDQLEDRWTNPDTENRASLRQLARYVNLQLLERAIAPTDMQLLDGELENLHDLLTADDVSSRARTEARMQLEQSGVNVEQLLEDFVSRQAIHTYLTNYRDVTQPTTEPSGDQQRLNRLESIQRLRNRLESMTETVLTKLRASGHLTLGEFSVIVSVQVHCGDCDTQLPVTTLLESGSCDCPSSTS